MVENQLTLQGEESGLSWVETKKLNLAPASHQLHNFQSFKMANKKSVKYAQTLSPS
jgi:hypothetical protein